ncbi:MAG: enoyl-CoA hydratase/isomerase family protein [Gemmatimonadota bacterium]|nr:MAG: enoyl-CoA hydratase/isomerase family protein [Gemmatimonadota bacterium]
MTQDLNILADIKNRVATLTINRPDKRNALNAATRSQFIEAMGQLETNDEIRVVVVTGAGDRAFVAGADITEFAGRSAVDQLEVMKRRTVYEAVDQFPKPVIAAVNGYCLGTGCELAMACDIRVVADNAKFGQPEINLGIIPGGGGTQRLPRLVGLGQALKLMFTGEIISAQRALEIGLADEVVPASDLRTHVTRLAATIAEKSPIALRCIKEAARASARMPLDEGLKLETSLFGLAFSSEDKKEGIAAFTEKRSPEFKGR